MKPQKGQKPTVHDSHRVRIRGSHMDAIREAYGVVMASDGDEPGNHQALMFVLCQAGVKVTSVREAIGIAEEILCG